jgi:hypothetical protein
MLNLGLRWPLIAELSSSATGKIYFTGCRRLSFSKRGNQQGNRSHENRPLHLPQVTAVSGPHHAPTNPEFIVGNIPTLRTRSGNPRCLRRQPSEKPEAFATASQGSAHIR